LVSVATLPKPTTSTQPIMPGVSASSLAISTTETWFLTSIRCAS
jgi:hypothetical protein